jgi:hypothetical protein
MNFQIKFLSVVLLCGFMFLVNAQSDEFYKKVDLLQESYVKDGLVNYVAIKDNPKLLRDTKNAFKKVSVDRMDDAELRAFYINAYNFWVIDKVISHYPIKSVMDIEDFFKQPYIRWEGNMMSLNEFEQQIFSKFPDDPRLHLVIVCAANGCPELSGRAFSKDNYKTKMKERTRNALRDPAMVKLDMHAKKAYVSKIFEWYHADFTKDKSLREFLNYYRNNDIPQGFEIVYNEYDWSLNDKKTQD